jgi:hypothetical protein
MHAHRNYIPLLCSPAITIDVWWELLQNVKRNVIFDKRFGRVLSDVLDKKVLDLRRGLGHF